MLLINGVYCSKAQKLICNYFNFEINCIIGCYCVDGVKDNCIIEYNGGGRDLQVKKGDISLKEFQKKENKRIDFLIKEGYRVLIINNPCDLEINEFFLKKYKRKYYN